MMRRVFIFLMSLIVGNSMAVADGLTDAQVLAAVRDLSGGDVVIEASAKKALKNGLPEYSGFIDWPDDKPGYRAAAVIAHAFEDAGRLIMLDWALGLDDCVALFEAMFDEVGLDTGGARAELATLPALARGDAVGVAYIAYRAPARAQGMRIFGINFGSDMYFFFLVPEGAAARWASVPLGGGMYFEDSDWQFKAELEAAGIVPLSERHPSLNPRSAPK